MLDIDKTIEGLDDINNRLGFKYSAVVEAIKALKMYAHIKYTASQWDVGKAQELRLHCIVEQAEEEFFPSLVSKTLIVKFDIPPGVPTKEFSTIRKLLERTRGVVVKTIRVEADDDKEK